MSKAPSTASEPTADEQEGPSHTPPSGVPPKERRFKLSRACDRCRRRRIKCDEGHPCQACLTANAACTFEEPGKRTHAHKSKRTATLEDRMHHLESLIQAIPPAVFAASNANDLAQQQNQISSPSSMMFPSGIPPPSLNALPITNPSNHFGLLPSSPSMQSQQSDTGLQFLFDSPKPSRSPPAARVSIFQSYLYFDDEGYTRWQGESSGLPLLDMLADRQHPQVKSEGGFESGSPEPTSANNGTNSTTGHPDWFPNRTARPSARPDPETMWRLITSHIPSELMDSLVQCFLSTSYYILPFMHVPTFLQDYGNPKKWGEPGFAAFIVSICCIGSRHVDDPRIKPDPSAGTQWFELLGRLRTLPAADRPTLYTIQASFLGAVYAVGLGRLSKAAALLGEAITLCVDAGLHRSADPYDVFDPVEEEVRRRTFWCVYVWDKQLAAHFGRPSMIRVRDCDVGEPAPVDDEFITREGIIGAGVGGVSGESRMSAFICVIRAFVVMESVLDVPPPRKGVSMTGFTPGSPLLERAASLLASEPRVGGGDMREEEALLDEMKRAVPPKWAYTAELRAGPFGDDIIRLTQSVRIHCAEHFVRMLIYRHRYTNAVVAGQRQQGHITDIEREEREKEAIAAAHESATQIVSAYLEIAQRGLMTYYGVHVIHQLTQAGRTIVAILLGLASAASATSDGNASEREQQMIGTGLQALRTCVVLLRRFSNRYVCGVRSGDLLEEFCRLTNIPLDSSKSQNEENNTSRPAWIRPVRKKAPSVSSAPRMSSADSAHSNSPDPNGNVGTPNADPFGPTLGSFLGSMEGIDGPQQQQQQLFMNPADVMALFQTDGTISDGQNPFTGMDMRG